MQHDERAGEDDQVADTQHVDGVRNAGCRPTNSSDKGLGLSSLKANPDRFGVGISATVTNVDVIIARENSDTSALAQGDVV